MQYCLTEETKADFFKMKPLQGKLFREFRDWIMNIQNDDLIAKPEEHMSALNKLHTLK